MKESFYVNVWLIEGNDSNGRVDDVIKMKQMVLVKIPFTLIFSTKIQIIWNGLVYGLVY